MAAREKTPDRRSFLGFVKTPSELRNMGVEERIEALERRRVNITSIEQKLDRVLQEKENLENRSVLYISTKLTCYVEGLVTLLLTLKKRGARV